MSEPMPIDPSRPWIKDPRDAPSRMNWADTLTNPLGKTGKLHFSRAWTIMFMGRLLMYLIPVVSTGLLSVAGADTSVLTKPVHLGPLSWPAMLIPFLVFALVTEFTSFIIHTRRLSDAGKPAIYATIVLIPLVLAMTGFIFGAKQGIAAYDARQAYVEARDTLRESPEDAEAKKIVEQGRKRGMERQLMMERRMGIEAPTQREMAAQGGERLGFMLWALGSFPVMLWTLLWVARLPNEGIGKLHTGSEMTPGELAAEHHI